MALDITVTPNGSYHSPGFDIEVTGLSAYDTFRVERIDTLGAYPDTPVRGMDDVPVTGDVASATDFEAPIARPTRYRVIGDGTDSATSTAETLPSDNPGATWLKSVAQPALSRRVNMTDWDDVTVPGRILGEYEVLGRRNKVVVTDVMGGREGTFTLATFPFGASWESDCYFRDLSALLEFGGTMLLQTSGPTTTGEEDLYFETKSIGRKRIGLVGGELVHLHDIAYIEVDPPATTEESLGLRSWNDISINFNTWGDVYTYYMSWLDVLSRP